MTTTAMTTLDVADGWTQLGTTDPADIRIKCNSAGIWRVAVAAAPPASDFAGEVYVNQFTSWSGLAITGNVYVRVEGDGMEFAVVE